MGRAPAPGTYFCPLTGQRKCLVCNDPIAQFSRADFRRKHLTGLCHPGDGASPRRVGGAGGGAAAARRRDRTRSPAGRCRLDRSPSSSEDDGSDADDDSEVRQFAVIWP